MKKPFVGRELHREIVEVLCDFVEGQHAGIPLKTLFDELTREIAPVRALWYVCSMFEPPVPSKKDNKEDKKNPTATADPYAEKSAKDIFGFDVRAFRNVRAVVQTLLMYLKQASTGLVPDKAMDAFVKQYPAQVPSTEVLVGKTQELLRGTLPEQLLTLQRVVLCMRAVVGKTGGEEAEELVASLVGPLCVRPEKAASTNPAERTKAFQTMLHHYDVLFPNPYVATKARIGQGLHYRPRLLRANETDILLDGSTVRELHSGDLVVDENKENVNLYRVAHGSFSVFVGGTKVATLIEGDWFGEMSMFTNFFAHGRVLCDKEKSRLNVVSVAHLTNILAARPDLAATFYSVYAYELASRLNVALIQNSVASVDKNDLSAKPDSGTHFLREETPVRPRVDDKETHFRYDAEIHAVRAYFCQRIPKKEKKAPRDALLYVFSTKLVSLYQKGHSQKKTIVSFPDLKNVTRDAMNVTIEFKDKKKDKLIHLRFDKEEAIAHAVAVINRLWKSFNGHANPLPNLALSTAVALFNFKPAADAADQLELVAGGRYTVLDRSGYWFYGFEEGNSNRKGLFPLSYVELRPYGILLEGVLLPEDWSSIESHFVKHVLKRGDKVIVEGDHTASGHLFFIKQGQCIASRRRANGLEDSLNVLHPGESVGELLFLLGGLPRASVSVVSDTAEVLQLPHDKLVKLLEDDKFGSRFWKYMCCLLASRINSLQLRLAKLAPPVPAPVKFDAPAQDQRSPAPDMAPTPVVTPVVAATRPPPPQAAPAGGAAPPGEPAPVVVAAAASAVSAEPAKQDQLIPDIPSGIDLAAQEKLLQQLKTVLSNDEDSSEGDPDDA